MTTQTFLRAVAAALVLTTTAAPAFATDDRGNAFGRSQAPAALEGAWQATITPVNCTTGTEFPQFAFASYLMFGSGGTITETTLNPRFQPGQRSPGLGQWTRTGRASYHARLQAFIQFDSVDPQPPAPFYQRGSQTLDQTIEMQDVDHWTSDADITFRDISGAVILSTGCAKAAAVRMR